MATTRHWKPLAIGLLFTLSLGHFMLAEDEVVQIGRRRRTESQSAAQRNAARAQTPRASTDLRAPTDDPRESPDEPAIGDSPTPRIDPLYQLAERAIATTSRRYLDADQHTPWQIMHGMVALRREFQLARGDEKINCVEFISDAPTFRGEYWWQTTPYGGRAHPFSVPYAFEGHKNQFLALLSMSNLPLSHRFNVDGEHTVTMADMVQGAKMSVCERDPITNAHEEITWTLWFLTHYVDIDSEWTNERGEPWSMERLVDIQTRAQVTGAPCGGTHGLFAIAYARNAFLQKHGRLGGVYFQADQKIKQHIELARSLQNNDGSFSSEFFKGPGYSTDFNERLKASGHMLEWLMMALPQSRLNEAWVRRAVASIATDLIHNAAQPAECGPLYHSLNSLIMYRDRMKPEMTPLEADPQLVEKRDDPSADATSVATPAVEPDQEPLVTSTPADNSAEPTAEEPIDRPLTAQPVPDKRAFTFSDLPARTTRSRSELLAQKAARRLAEAVRDAELNSPAIPEEEQPSLLQVPANGTRRMAIEPSDRELR